MSMRTASTHERLPIRKYHFKKSSAQRPIQFQYVRQKQQIGGKGDDELKLMRWICQRGTEPFRKDHRPISASPRQASA
jgi:hypothetical protein